MKIKELILAVFVLLAAAACQKSDDIRPVTPSDTDTIVVAEPVPALFSINEKEQVRFASGNLQYVEGVWRFAEKQTDFLPFYDAEHCDLFTWSTTNTLWGLDASTNPPDYEFSFVDWGTIPQLVATYGEGWRVLDAIEWDYLLNERLVNGQAGEGHSWIATSIDGQYGVLLYPDGFVQQESHDAGVIPDSCVFLPAMGYRLGHEIQNRGNHIGYYWSASTTYCPPGAVSLQFREMDGSTTIGIYADARYYGSAVRLVKDVL